MSLPEFKEARTILLYSSFRSEVETDELLTQSLQVGKTVALPLIQPDQKELLACTINNPTLDLQRGKLGIKEPIKEMTEPLAPQEIDLVIIPGVAFDLSGHRLGWGAGYYDRFLARLPNSVTRIALAYELQVLEQIPAAEHDISVHLVVTEERVINCRKPVKSS